MIKSFLTISILTLGLLCSSCGASKTDTTAVAEPHMNTNNPEKLAKTFVKAIAENDKSLLKEYRVTSSIISIMLPPGEVVDNETLENEIAGPIIKRFDENIANIQKAIDENDIDRSKLKYKSYKYEATGQPNQPKPLVIFMDYKDKEIDLPLTVTELNGKWYVFEILLSTGLFD